jgi:hypothetical protein
MEKKHHDSHGGTIWIDELSKECIYLACMLLLNYRTESFAQRPNTKCVILYQGRGIKNTAEKRLRMHQIMKIWRGI